MCNFLYMFQKSILLPSLISSLLVYSNGSAQWLQDTGADELLSYLRVSEIPRETTQGLSVTMVEAPTGNGSYLPNAASFPNQTFVNVTNTSNGVSGHANTVAGFFYSEGDSYARSIDTVYMYSADDFILNNLGASNFGTNPFLSFATPVPVLPFTTPVASFAWVSTTTGAGAEELLHRYDYLAVSSNTLLVAGLNNGSGTSVPSLWGHSYNGLVVGTSLDNHSSGDTSNIFSPFGITGGRTKPDLVSTGNLTSWSTGQISSGAIYLYGVADNLGFSEITSNIDLQKAIILAGATKDEFPGWVNHSTDPENETRSLDERYGAGEMNVLNSQRIIEGGQVTEDRKMGYHGWDRASVSDNVVEYQLTIPEGVAFAELSLVACWNREVIENAFDFFGTTNYVYTPQDLADLKLEISDSAGNAIYVSDSTVDNVEHVFAIDLIPGDYTVSVSNNSGLTIPTEYGLAWKVSVDAVALPSIVIADEGLDISGLITGISYDVEESSDLVTWSLLGTVDTSMPTTDFAVPEADEQRFFRIKYWE